MTAKPKPTIGPATLLHRNPYVEINHISADFGAFVKDDSVVKFGPRAGVPPVRGGEVLLVRQYRFLAGGASWEFPGGKVDPGEDPRAAAVRRASISATGSNGPTISFPGRGGRGVPVGPAR